MNLGRWGGLQFQWMRDGFKRAKRGERRADDDDGTPSQLWHAIPCCRDEVDTQRQAQPCAFPFEFAKFLAPVAFVKQSRDVFNDREAGVLDLMREAGKAVVTRVAFCPPHAIRCTPRLARQARPDDATLEFMWFHGCHVAHLARYIWMPTAMRVYRDTPNVV
jgi:hypothetical protein